MIWSVWLCVLAMMAGGANAGGATTSGGASSGMPLSYQILIFAIVAILILAAIWCFFRRLVACVHSIYYYFNGGYDYSA